MVWDGRDTDKNDDWIARLDNTDIASIRTAVEVTKSSNTPVGALTRDDFGFGNFGNKLLWIRDEILSGAGYSLVRGLNESNSWSNEDLIRAYWGIGCWLGDAVSQNAKAHLLGHVIDQRINKASGTRIYQTNQAQPFHSDSCDIVGLLCLRVAQYGGASSIASSSAIHNDLLDNNPQALDTLYGNFQCDRYGEIPEGKHAHYSVRVFNEVNHQLVCCGMDPDIRSAQRLDDVQPLSDAQSNALDAFQATARKLALNMSLQRGDMQFVNNHIVVHARSEFQDYEEPDRRRYLIRLWLSSRQGRTLPEFLAERWGNIEPGTIRGGISVPGSTPAVHLNPDL